MLGEEDPQLMEEKIGVFPLDTLQADQEDARGKRDRDAEVCEKGVEEVAQIFAEPENIDVFVCGCNLLEIGFQSQGDEQELLSLRPRGSEKPGYLFFGSDGSAARPRLAPFHEESAGLLEKRCTLAGYLLEAGEEQRIIRERMPQLCDKEHPDQRFVENEGAEQDLPEGRELPRRNAAFCAGSVI